jgi:hypothetical protein
MEGGRNLALHTRFDAKDPVCAVLLAHVKHDKVGKKCSEFSRKRRKNQFCVSVCVNDYFYFSKLSCIPFFMCSNSAPLKIEQINFLLTKLS